MNYGFAYAIGFHPWEDAEAHPPFAEKISAIFDREESGREPPYGPALDLGTGSGIWAIHLVKRGWQVTAVDIVDRALRRARERVDQADVDVRLVKADVTALRAAGIGSGFRLLLDTGTFHGLNSAQREAMGREVSSLAADDATVLLLAWEPKRRGPLPRGVSRGEVESAFHGWKVTHVEPSYFQAPKPVELLLKPDEHWYRSVASELQGTGGEMTEPLQPGATTTGTLAPSAYAEVLVGARRDRDNSLTTTQEEAR